jgi:hypothetical protein
MVVVEICETAQHLVCSANDRIALIDTVLDNESGVMEKQPRFLMDLQILLCNFNTEKRVIGIRPCEF